MTKQACLRIHMWMVGVCCPTQDDQPDLAAYWIANLGHYRVGAVTIHPEDVVSQGRAPTQRLWSDAQVKSREQQLTDHLDAIDQEFGLNKASGAPPVAQLRDLFEAHIKSAGILMRERCRGVACLKSFEVADHLALLEPDGSNALERMITEAQTQAATRAYLKALEVIQAVTPQAGDLADVSRADALQALALAEQAIRGCMENTWS